MPPLCGQFIRCSPKYFREYTRSTNSIRFRRCSGRLNPPIWKPRSGQTWTSSSRPWPWMWRSALRRACRQHETVIGQTRIGTVLRDDVDLTLIGAYLFDRPLNETNADRIENVHQRCAHEISIGLVKSWAMCISGCGATSATSTLSVSPRWSSRRTADNPDTLHENCLLNKKSGGIAPAIPC